MKGIQDLVTGAILLDYFPGAAVGWSLRNIRSGATLCVRVRRSSDNAETDIGFNGEIIDENALLAFCGAGSGYVVVWYDQTGNGRDASQTTAMYQPRIVNAGVVEKAKGWPTIYFNGGNYLSFTVFINDTLQSITSFIVAKKAALGSALTEFILNSTKTGTNRYAIGWSGGGSEPVATARQDAVGAYTNTNNGDLPVLELVLITSFALQPTRTSKLYQNDTLGSQSGTLVAAFATANGTIGDRGNQDRFLTGYISEIVIYLDDKSSQRAEIDNNINTYYGLY